jgi:hypothetical protein
LLVCFDPFNSIPCPRGAGSKGRTLGCGLVESFTESRRRAWQTPLSACCVRAYAYFGVVPFVERKLSSFVSNFRSSRENVPEARGSVGRHAEAFPTRRNPSFCQKKTFSDDRKPVPYLVTHAGHESPLFSSGASFPAPRIVSPHIGHASFLRATATASIGRLT